MKRLPWFLALLMAVPAFGSALGTSSRSVIPAEAQQVICVDYRALKNSPTALALKDRVLPDNMKEFETSLKAVGINPEQDVEQLTFASYRNKDNTLQVFGIAQGTFSVKKITAKLALKKIKGVKYHDSVLYPMSGGQDMTFLDDSTMLFGQRTSVKGALDARDGYRQPLDISSQMGDMMNAVQNGPIWSVLDQLGTQNMMRSTLGDAAKLADYDTIKKRILGSHYIMDFQNGVNFDLDIVTNDPMTAATLSSVLKAGVMFRKMNASGVEKVALDSVTVDSSSADLKLHFKSDEKRFQSLLQSDLFASVSR